MDIFQISNTGLSEGENVSGSLLQLYNHAEKNYDLQDKILEYGHYNNTVVNSITSLVNDEHYDKGEILVQVRAKIDEIDNDVISSILIYWENGDLAGSYDSTIARLNENLRLLRQLQFSWDNEYLTVLLSYNPRDNTSISQYFYSFKEMLNEYIISLQDYYRRYVEALWYEYDYNLGNSIESDLALTKYNEVYAEYKILENKYIQNYSGVDYRSFTLISLSNDLIDQQVLEEIISEYMENTYAEYDNLYGKLLIPGYKERLETLLLNSNLVGRISEKVNIIRSKIGSITNLLPKDFNYNFQYTYRQEYQKQYELYKEVIDSQTADDRLMQLGISYANVDLFYIVSTFREQHRDKVILISYLMALQSIYEIDSNPENETLNFDYIKQNLRTGISNAVYYSLRNNSENQKIIDMYIASINGDLEDISMMLQQEGYVLMPYDGYRFTNGYHKSTIEYNSRFTIRSTQSPQGRYTNFIVDSDVFTTENNLSVSSLGFTNETFIGPYYLYFHNNNDLSIYEYQPIIDDSYLEDWISPITFIYFDNVLPTINPLNQQIERKFYRLIFVLKGDSRDIIYHKPFTLTYKNSSHTVLRMNVDRNMHLELPAGQYGMKSGDIATLENISAAKLRIPIKVNADFYLDQRGDRSLITKCNFNYNFTKTTHDKYKKPWVLYPETTDNSLYSDANFCQPFDSLLYNRNNTTLHVKGSFTLPANNRSLKNTTSLYPEKYCEYTPYEECQFNVEKQCNRTRNCAFCDPEQSSDCVKNSANSCRDDCVLYYKSVNVLPDKYTINGQSAGILGIITSNSLSYYILDKTINSYVYKSLFSEFNINSLGINRIASKNSDRVAENVENDSYSLNEFNYMCNKIINLKVMYQGRVPWYVIKNINNKENVYLNMDNFSKTRVPVPYANYFNYNRNDEPGRGGQYTCITGGNNNFKHFDEIYPDDVDAEEIPYIEDKTPSELQELIQGYYLKSFDNDTDVNNETNTASKTMYEYYKYRFNASGLYSCHDTTLLPHVKSYCNGICEHWGIGMTNSIRATKTADEVHKRLFQMQLDSIVTYPELLNQTIDLFARTTGEEFAKAAVIVNRKIDMFNLFYRRKIYEYIFDTGNIMNTIVEISSNI